MNSPDGFPVTFLPVNQPHYGQNVWEKDDAPMWWSGSDRPWDLLLEGQQLHAAAHRATNLIVDPLVNCRWSVVDPLSEVDNTSVPFAKVPSPRWILDPMLTRPDLRFGAPSFPVARRMNSATFWGQWVRAALWHGTGYLLFVRGQDGMPTPGTLRIADPTAVSITERGTYLLGDTYEQIETDADGMIEIGPYTWQIVALRNPHSPVAPDGSAQGVLQRFADIFRQHSTMNEYQSKIFDSEGRPSGWLQVSTPGLKQGQADDLKKAWMEAHGGDRRSVAVLGATVSYHEASQMTPLDTAIGDLKRLSVFDLAHSYNLDPEMLSISSGGGYLYSNWNDRIASYRISSLNPWVVGLQETLSSVLPGTQGVLLDLDTLLRADMASRVDAYGKAIAAGIYTPDEVRALEGLPPLNPLLASSPEEGAEDVAAATG